MARPKDVQQEGRSRIIFGKLVKLYLILDCFQSVVISDMKSQEES